MRFGGSGSDLLNSSSIQLTPTGLIFNNCTLCPHCIYVFCIYLRTATYATCTINRLVFITEMKVFTARYGLSL